MDQQTDRQSIFLSFVSATKKRRKKRINSNPVADSWVGAVMQKNARISKMLWDRPTDQHGKV